MADCNGILHFYRLRIGMEHLHVPWQPCMENKFFSPAAVNIGKLKQSRETHKDKRERNCMKPALADKVGSLKHEAQVRIVIPVLVSFFLGVAVTAVWFHFTANHAVKNSSFPTNGKPSAGQSALRAVNARQTARPYVPSQPPVSPEAIKEVKQAIPNFASVSLADGMQILREAALKKFAAAAKETDAQVGQARQRLIQAENGQPAVVQQAARKHLQQVQAAAAGKLQQIAAQLQTQIAALKRLKNAE